MSDRPGKISATQLIDLMARQPPPLVFDVRKNDAFSVSDGMIPSAIKENHETIADKLDDLVGKFIVVYCVHGHEVSQGAAMALRAAGHDVAYLEGGFEGYVEAGGKIVAKTINAGPEAGTE